MNTKVVMNGSDAKNVLINCSLGVLRVQASQSSAPKSNMGELNAGRQRVLGRRWRELMRWIERWEG